MTCNDTQLRPKKAHTDTSLPMIWEIEFMFRLRCHLSPHLTLSQLTNSGSSAFVPNRIPHQT